jgi:RNA polymerase sigma-70 factor (ECF subfamily)
VTREQFISHVESSQKALRRFLVALCNGDSQLADDIAQETYMKAYMSCDKFNNPDKFNAWIYRIANNTFINHNRSLKTTFGYDQVSDISSGTKADSTFQYQDLYAALRNLSNKERTSILLYYMEGYSIKEISKIIDITQDAVKQHLSRGRNHLRNMLKNK